MDFSQDCKKVSEFLTSYQTYAKVHSLPVLSEDRFSSPAVYGVLTRFADERQSQHPGQSQSLGIPKL
jgi:hypothetical protein